MAQTEESTAAKRFMKSVSSITFDPFIFGAILAGDDPKIQDRVMRIVVQIIRHFSSHYLTHNHTEENDYAITLARRLNDTLDLYS